MDLAVGPSDGTRIGLKTLGGFDRSKRVFVDGVMMVLIELKQAADVLKAGEYGFQNAILMQTAQGIPELPCRSEQCEKRMCGV